MKIVVSSVLTICVFGFNYNSTAQIAKDSSITRISYIDSCQEKLFQAALNSFGTESYLLCFSLRLNDTVERVIATNAEVWSLFKSNGYTFDQYHSFMWDLLKKKLVLDIDSLFTRKQLYYTPVKEHKENQENLQDGVHKGFDYFIETRAQSKGRSRSYMSDIIWQFWQWNIGVIPVENDDFSIARGNCYGLKW